MSASGLEVAAFMTVVLITDICNDDPFSHNITYYCDFFMMRTKATGFHKTGIVVHYYDTMMMIITTINERERGHSYRKVALCLLFFFRMY